MTIVMGLVALFVVYAVFCGPTLRDLLRKWR